MNKPSVAALRVRVLKAQQERRAALATNDEAIIESARIKLTIAGTKLLKARARAAQTGGRS